MSWKRKAERTYVDRQSVGLQFFLIFHEPVVESRVCLILHRLLKCRGIFRSLDLRGSLFLCFYFFIFLFRRGV